MNPLLRLLRTTAALATLGLCAASPALALDALVVVDTPGSLPVADARVVAQLTLLGLTPVLVDDDVVVAGDATGKALVFVSASVSSGKVGNTFETVAVPVVVAEGFIFDDMGMTLGTFGTHFGTTAGQSQLAVTGASVLTAGLSGNIVMSGSPHTILWGNAGASAIVAATEVGTPGHATIFAYESGSPMPSGNFAPARRLALPIGTDVSLDWTADMKQLFSAAIEWTSGSAVISRTRIQLLGDSITSGAGGFTSYRPDLFALLEAQECSVDFIGTQYTDHGLSFDADHQGVNAFTTALIEGALPTTLLGNRPDVVLLFAGTVDVINGRTTTAIDTDLRDIIALLRAAEPNVTILIAQIIPNLPANDADVAALNVAVAQIAVDLDTPGARVIAVDHITGYDPVTMTSGDDIQPNALGDAFIANTWSQALLPELGEVKCPGLVTAVPVSPPLVRWIMAALILAFVGAATFAPRRFAGSRI